MQDMVTFLKSELYEFAYLQQNAFDKEDSYSPLERQVPLFELVQAVFETNYQFASHDEARSYFLELQNDIKNMNFMPFGSDEYKRQFKQIEERIQKSGMKS